MRYEALAPSVEISRHIKEEINDASLYLENYRRNNECVNISEEIWNYSKNLLKDIFIHYSKKYPLGFQVPKIVFIDDSILIRWENKNSKLILSLSDHTSAIAVNIKDKNGQYITGYIHKNEIIDWVTFWLRKLKDI